MTRGGSAAPRHSRVTCRLSRFEIIFRVRPGDVSARLDVSAEPCLPECAIQFAEILPACPGAKEPRAVLPLESKELHIA